MLRRVVRSLLFGPLLVLLAVFPASAATVTREPLQLPPVIDDESCGYTILVTFPINQQVITTRYDASGNPVSFVITGHLVVSLTNPDTGEALTANISGPTLVGHDGTVYYVGRTGLPGEGLLIISGRINTSTGEINGHVSVDVCEALPASA